MAFELIDYLLMAVAALAGAIGRLWQKQERMHTSVAGKLDQCEEHHRRCEEDRLSQASQIADIWRHLSSAGGTFAPPSRGPSGA